MEKENICKRVERTLRVREYEVCNLDLEYRTKEEYLDKIAPAGVDDREPINIGEAPDLIHLRDVRATSLAGAVAAAKTAAIEDIRGYFKFMDAFDGYDEDTCISVGSIEDFGDIEDAIEDASRDIINHLGRGVYAASLRIEFETQYLDENTAILGAGVYDIENDELGNYEFIVVLKEEE